MVNIRCFVLYPVRNNTFIPAAVDLADDSADRKLYMVLCDRCILCAIPAELVSFAYLLQSYVFVRHV